jgi:hypothetical protein
MDAPHPCQAAAILTARYPFRRSGDVMGWRSELCFNDWAGFYTLPVFVVGETPKRYRIEALQDMRMAGRNRYLRAGQCALAPPHRDPVSQTMTSLTVVPTARRHFSETAHAYSTPFSGGMLGVRPFMAGTRRNPTGQRPSLLSR